MPHYLFTGVTESGKTTLARDMARRLPPSTLIIVRDPEFKTATAGGGWPERAEVYDDDEEFFARVFDLMADDEPCLVMVDEAADIFDHAHKENAWILRKCRHRLMYFALIAQRPKMLAPNVRSQCTRLFIFRLNKSDMADMLADAGHDMDVLNDANGKYKSLDQGEYLALNTGSAGFKRAHLKDIVKNWNPERK